MEGLSKETLNLVPEAAKGPASFRRSQDVENLYRFVCDNNLRREAKMILDFVYSRMGLKKKKRKSRSRKLQ